MQSKVYEQPNLSIPLKRQVEPIAEALDNKQFWQDLRYFYRTGKQPSASRTEGLTSIFKYKIGNLPTSSPAILNHKEITFTNDTILHLINRYLSDYQLDTIKRFQQKLHTLSASLAMLLEVNTADPISSDSYGFAYEIIAFDKLSKLIPKHSGPALSDNRKKRLTKTLELLKDGLNQYQIAQALLLVTKEKQTEKIPERFDQISIWQNDAIKETQGILKKHVNAFTTLIKAYRIATLEIDDAYDELIHNDYFDHFTWYRLSEEEQSWFRPVILQIDHQLVMQQLDDLSQLLSTNWPIKLLVMNHVLVSEPTKELSWEEASHRYRPELAALAMAHRNVAVYQTTLNDPEQLTPLIKSWIHDIQPTLMHVLAAATEEDLLKTNAALYGRYFPQLTYSRQNEKQHPFKWNIDHNPSPDTKWPLMNFEVILNDQVDHQSIAFTYADYKAFYDSKVKELMVVPEAYRSDFLIALSDYLELSPENLIGKIPYIWLMDQRHNLHRAAVPNVWVVSCQERLNNWTFLQEMAGNPSIVVRSFEKNEEPGVNEDQLKVIKEEATRIAATRLINELLSEI